MAVIDAGFCAGELPPLVTRRRLGEVRLVLLLKVVLRSFCLQRCGNLFRAKSVRMLHSLDATSPSVFVSYVVQARSSIGIGLHSVAPEPWQARACAAPVRGIGRHHALFPLRAEVSCRLCHYHAGTGWKSL